MYSQSYFNDRVSTENFELIKTNHKKLKKFNTETTDYQVVFKNIPSEFIDSIFYMNEIMQLRIQEFSGKNLQKR
jgi:hypothetical protein